MSYYWFNRQELLKASTAFMKSVKVPFRRENEKYISLYFCKMMLFMTAMQRTIAQG